MGHARSKIACMNTEIEDTPEALVTVVPDDWKPGQKLTVGLPSGRAITVTVPELAQPGQEIEVLVPGPDMDVPGRGRPLNALSERFPDAVEHLGESESQRLREGFRRVSAGQVFDWHVFTSCFLAEVSPWISSSLASMIFKVLDIKMDNVISESEFITAIAVARQGSEAERLRLIYAAIVRSTAQKTLRDLQDLIAFSGVTSGTAPRLPTSLLVSPLESEEDFMQACHLATPEWRSMAVLALSSCFDPLFDPSEDRSETGAPSLALKRSPSSMGLPSADDHRDNTASSLYNKLQQVC